MEIEIFSTLNPNIRAKTNEEIVLKAEGFKILIDF